MRQTEKRSGQGRRWRVDADTSSACPVLAKKWNMLPSDLEQYCQRLKMSLVKLVLGVGTSATFSFMFFHHGPAELF